MFSTVGAQVWIWLIFLALLHCKGTGSQLSSYVVTPRWGQATAILDTTLLVSGGKTDPQHQFTYTSAPNTNDLLSLDLSSSFSVSSPPWVYISGSQNKSTSQGPSVAFHTLTPFTTTQLLLFGGNSGFDFIQTNNDSSWLLSVDSTDPIWNFQEAGWAGEPMRRLYHAAPAAFGAVFIVGGLKGDQSQLGFPDSFLFNAVGDDGSPIFIPLTNSTNAPSGLFGHAAHVLPNGRLIVFGGFFSRDAPVASPLSTIYVLDTTQTDLSWTIRNTSGENIPGNRRDFTSVVLDDGKILVHGGGDEALQTIFQDGAILDTTVDPMSWSSVDSLSGGLGPRIGHFSVAINGQVLFGLGWAGIGPANATLSCFDLKSNEFLSTYTAPTAPSTTTTLPISPTAPGGTAISQPGNHDGSGTTKSPQSPTLTSPADPTFGGSKSSKTGAIIGVVVGSLAFVVLVSVVVYSGLKRRDRFAWMGSSFDGRRDEGHWKLISEDGAGFPAIRLAGKELRNSRRHGHGILGLSSFMGANGYRPPTHRRDMLADEDAYSFDVDPVLEDHDQDDQGLTWGREGSVATSASYKSTGLNALWNISVSSLRNVGLAIALKSRPNEFGTSNGNDHVSQERRLEEVDIGTGSVADAQSFSTKPQNSIYDTIETSNAYIDPFSDNNRVLDLNYQDQSSTNDSAPIPGSNKSLPSIPEGSALNRINTNSSEATGEQWNTSQESTSDHTLQSGTASSNKSVGLGSYNSHQHTSNSHELVSFIGSNTLADPVRRSSTWWTRLSRSTFRDKSAHTALRRRKSEAVDFLPEFRDPNPPPRLASIEETNVQSCSPNTGAESSRRRQASDSGASTKSSVKTGRTADTDLIEHLGENMEVVQRAISRGSRQTASTSTTFGPTSHGKSLSQNSEEINERSWTSPNNVETSSIVESVIETSIRTSSPISEIAESNINIAGDTPEPRSSRGASTGLVATKVAMYERQTHQHSRPSNAPRALRTKHLSYGLAPKSPLFVANPEHPSSPSS